MLSIPDAILESSGCAHTVRVGVPAHARDKDTRAIASGLAKRWGQATSPPKASAAGVNGRANGSGMSSAPYVPDVPRSAEVIAAEQAAEEVMADPGSVAFGVRNINSWRFMPATLRRKSMTLCVVQ